MSIIAAEVRNGTTAFAGFVQNIRRSASVKSFGRRQAYESPRGRNPRATGDGYGDFDLRQMSAMARPPPRSGGFDADGPLRCATSISAPASPATGEIDGQEVIGQGIFTRADGSSGSFVEVALETALGTPAGDQLLIGGDSDDVLLGAASQILWWEATELTGLSSTTSRPLTWSPTTTSPRTRWTYPYFSRRGQAMSTISSHMIPREAT
ncbi:hypothetical protein [Mesorhizobium sp. dw_380]|uniref:hypothetical protein n=1 Tax=Mesorhizobium sp. dw_380 TaxID=2812001 RepID=UPI0020322DC1|nr:hypothetical protein [Mesorhizobium sp. dw_380]